MIDCAIGEVYAEMLINSGNKYNLLTGNTWEELKKRKIMISNKKT